MLSSRISRRVLAEHHIALSRAFSSKDGDQAEDKHVGIIYTALNVRRSIERCASLLQARKFAYESESGDIKEPPVGAQWPQVIIEGHVETNFSYIKEHLEYV
jgi:pyruvate dehydrogenase kinase 2/3/4